VALLKARAEGGGVIGRLVGQHPDGGPVTVRDGRYGAYVNWGKVNATIPKGTAPDAVTLGMALELLAEREGKPAAQPRRAARSAPGKSNPSPAKAPAPKAAATRATPRAAAARKGATKKQAIKPRNGTAGSKKSRT
jgi:DNA topoisomerase I